MDRFKIFLGDDSFYSEQTSIENGSRNDVLVQIENKLYHLSVYNIFALAQEFNESNNNGQIYNIDNNIILVDNLSNAEIIKAICCLYSNNYFTRTKEIDLEVEFKDSFVLFPQLRTIKGWVQIY